MNNTIVFNDKIRENRRDSARSDIIELTDRSISLVLLRSVNSSVISICIVSMLWAM